MVLGSGSKLVPVLVFTNLWTLALLFLAWNHSAQYEVAQTGRNVDHSLVVPPERLEIGEIGEEPLSSVYHKPEPSEVHKGEGVDVATQPVRPTQDPNLPAFCPECGQGDVLCAKYGSVSTLCTI